MRFLTWILLFVLTFVVALVMVLTFMQPEFKQVVGAQILTLKTRPIPVYLYVLAAFVFGLGLGTSAAIYNFIRSKALEIRKNRQIRELEEQLSDTKRMLTVKAEMEHLIKKAAE